MPYATNDEVRIYYEVEGDGPPLVLHGGFMANLQAWRREPVGVTEALHGEYRLILLDPRGHGSSDKPHEASAYSLTTRVRDVTAVLEAEGIARAHFWGYSAGGVVGLGLGIYAPERCRSLILGGVDPSYVNDPVGSRRMAAELRRGTIADHLARREARDGALPPDARRDFLANDPLALAAIREATATDPGIAEAALSIAIPTLLYAGEQDATFAGARRAAQTIPAATFVPLAGRDHDQAFQDAAAILPHVCAFLARVG